MLLFFIVGIVPALIIENVVVHSYESRAVSQRTILVKNQCDMLADQLVRRGYMDNPDDEVINAECDMLTNIYNGRILIINQDDRVIRDTYNLDLGKTSLSQEVIDCFSGKETSLYDDDHQYIEMTVAIRNINSEAREIIGVLLISVSTVEINNSKNVLERRGTVTLGIVIAAILVVCFFLSKVLVRPFQKITSAIEGITDGYQDEDISVSDYIETELITDAFNRMLTRVKTVDDTRDEFVSNVSHELKTPLAS